VIVTSNTNYINSLKQCGLKSTKQRIAILDILEQSDQPIAAEQVFLDLKQREIAVNLSTVYRTLETLVNKSIVAKLTISGDNRTLFEYNRLVHRHYLVCLGCKRILAIDSCPLEDYERFLAQKTNFKIAGHKLNIYGYCSKCQKREK